jgi:AcrR family transcriptional regulator
MNPLRVDAERNRRLVLDAAAAAFAEGGLDVGVAEIAHRAGVGNATVFRRFPSKDDLILAVIEDRCSDLIASARAAAAEPDPWQGLRVYLEGMVEWQASDRGCLEGIAAGFLEHPRLQELHAELNALVDDVIDRARAAGVVRADLTATDLKFLASAAARATFPYAESMPDLWRRYLGIMLDGLRPDAATPLSAPAPTMADITAAHTDAQRRRE